MKYCSNCGSSNLEFKIPEDDHCKRYSCKGCETIFYTNPNMIVGALCIRDEKILMAKRNIHPRKGLWTLPAGFMENAHFQLLSEWQSSLSHDQTPRGENINWGRSQKSP